MRLPLTSMQYRLFLRELKKFDPSKNYRVLEVGADKKLVVEYLPKNFIYESLDIGKEYDYNFNLDKGKIPIRSNSYDIILCLETLEHTMFPERIIKELIRIGKNDASFFFSLPNEYNFLQRIYFLLGKKTDFDEPFQIVEKHLHIHKPRVEDVINLFSKHLSIKKIDYVWQSKHSNPMFKLSPFFRQLDKTIDFSAQLLPSLFARVVSVNAMKKH